MNKLLKDLSILPERIIYKKFYWLKSTSDKRIIARYMSTAGFSLIIANKLSKIDGSEECYNDFHYVILNEDKFWSMINNGEIAIDITTYSKDI